MTLGDADFRKSPMKMVYSEIDDEERLCQLKLVTRLSKRPGFTPDLSIRESFRFGL